MIAKGQLARGDDDDDNDDDDEDVNAMNIP